MKRILFLFISTLSILNIYAQSKKVLRQEIARLRSDSLMQEQVIANQNHRIEQLLNKGRNLWTELTQLRQDSVLMALRIEELETEIEDIETELKTSTQKLRELISVMTWRQIGSDIDGEEAFEGSGYSVSLSGDGNTVAIVALSGSVSIYQNVNGRWRKIGSDIDPGESAGEPTGEGGYNFKISASLNNDGSTVAIGAQYYDGNGKNAGHVRIYQNVNGSWIQIGSDIDGEAEGDFSGSSVSLSSDGSIVAIGAPLNDGNGQSAGHVRIYQNVNGSWIQIGSDIDGEAAFEGSGYSVSLSSDGNTVAIGANINIGNYPPKYKGFVRIYQNVNGGWTQIGSDIVGSVSGEGSGYSVSLSSDGRTVAVGNRKNFYKLKGSGVVRIYRNVNGSWTKIGSDINGEREMDYSGCSVSLSSDGSIVAIGAMRNDGNGEDAGSVRIYQNFNGSWIQIGSDIDGEAARDYFGWSVSLSSDGSTVAIGARENDGNGERAGHVRVFKLKCD